MTTRGTKCYLYFDEKGPANIQELIASKNLATRTDFSTTLTEDTTGTIYYEDTSKGRTYYFAGNPTDNWVQFGGFYWRIIRINENGSLRLIYSGNESSGPAEKGIYTRIGTSVFNDKYNDNAYIGYMFGTPKSDTYEKTHMNINDSTIKKVLDEWYQNNLLQYANKVDGNAGFCGDRTSSTNNNSIDNQGGKSKDTTYYGSHIRYYGQSNGRPTYECRDSDLYTLVGSSGGNKSLNYPIGLISMDEVWYAGGYQTINKNYYLCSGESYYTMSPNYYQLGGGEAIIFAIGPDGNLSHHSVFPSDTGMSIRPVINLCSDVIISSGTGTITAPYIIS